MNSKPPKLFHALPGQKARRAIVFLLLTVAAGACTQANPTGEVGAFAEATKSYVLEAEQAYQTINRVTMERRIAELSTENDSRVLGTQLVDSKTLQNTDTLSPFLGGVALEIRLALLRALHGYASGLSELSTANYKKEIDAAAEELGGAFRTLSLTLTTTRGSGTPLSDAEAGAITAAVAAFGNDIVEDKRLSAVKEIVIRFNPVIQETSRAISSGDWDALSDLQLANYDLLYAEDVKAYQKEYAHISHAERRRRLRAISDSYAVVRGTPAFFDDLRKASAMVGNAHQALAEAVSANRFTSQDVVRQVSELAALLDSLGAFRDRFEARN